MMIYACPVDERLSCQWEGHAINDIKQHFQERHSGLLFHTNSIQIDLSIPNENRLMVCGEQIYLLQSTIKDDKVLIRLRQPQTVFPHKLFDILVTVNDHSYSYGREKLIPIIVTCDGGWEINLQLLNELHGHLEFITCTILLQDQDPYVFGDDDIEEKLQQAIDDADRKIHELKAKHDDDGLFDGISQLNFDQLERTRDRKPSIGEHRRSETIDGFFGGLPGITEDIREFQLSCSTCNQDMLPPIYLCMNKHNVCVNCQSKLCKQCKGEVTNQRNTELENVSRNQRHPCKYARYGCFQKLKYDEVRSHEMKCTFCRYTCPIYGCTFENKYANFINHMNVHHTTVKVNYSLVNKFPKNVEFCVADKELGIFYCVSKQINNVITWSVTFCGPKEKRFFYELYFPGSRDKESYFLKKQEHLAYVLCKTKLELKNIRAKKPAELKISSYDN